ncbi:cocaine esterase-like [Anolis carolinensis]|uniref:cocaine esterase-like n=1 Tax=Anolis carolinensis TaxID=28377 RepID=UPI002F2B47F8
MSLKISCCIQRHVSVRLDPELGLRPETLGQDGGGGQPRPLPPPPLCVPSPPPLSDYPSLWGALTPPPPLSPAGPGSARPTVSTRLGRLRGTLLSVEGAPAPVKAFLGVPFASPPPPGALRFAPPEPPQPWAHLREAASQPPLCLQDLSWMQELNQGLNLTLPHLPLSGDCLYLNVFTPDTEATLPVSREGRGAASLAPVPGREPRPVHGGALVVGSASFYDARGLAALEGVVVVVVLQYRLGIPGFFGTGSKEAPGNWGLLDQVAALRWVQENIKAFGGDPTSVTTMGESAGAFSVGVQVLSPLSRGLFHRAIAESGVALLPSLFVRSPGAMVQALVRPSTFTNSSIKWYLNFLLDRCNYLLGCLGQQQAGAIFYLNCRVLTRPARLTLCPLALNRARSSPVPSPMCGFPSLWGAGGVWGVSGPLPSAFAGEHTEEEKRLSKTVMRYWANFARSG